MARGSELMAKFQIAERFPEPQIFPTVNLPFPWWVQTVVILGALLMLIGAAIALLKPAMLLSPNDQISAAVHVYAGYLVSRNAALAIFLLAALFLRTRGMLNTLLLLTALIQILDAVLDALEGRWPIVPGILIFAAIYLVAAAKLSGHPFWKIRAWGRTP
jgi:hypothetical protein